MNKVEIIGRLTKPVLAFASENGNSVARYTLAVTRNNGRNNEADFISCVAFGNQAAFAEKYLQKGMKIGVSGHLQSSSYQKDGETVYTMDVVVAEHEFCEKRNGDSGEAVA